jgi:hypothetical protein
MAQGESVDDGQGGGSPWSSTSLQVATLFLIVLAVVGIAIAIFHHGSQRHTRVGNAPPASHGANPPATTTAAAAPTGGLCSLPAGDQQVPSASYPQGVTWQAVGTMTAPQSSTLGPQHVKDGINVCFAHSPSGALLAAMNLWAEGSTQISERKVFSTLAIHVPSVVTNQPAGQDYEAGLQLAGYKFDSYTSSNALLEVVFRHEQGGLSAVQTPMSWTGDDWKYVFPPAGPVSTTLNGTQVQPPYVAWSAF